MNHFFKYILSITLLLISLLYACDFLYTQVYTRSTPRNKLQYILSTTNKHFDVVFVGSSRVANHIDTHLFDSLSAKKTLNIGVEGAGLNDNLLQLKLLISQNKIDNLFLEVDSNFEFNKPSNIATSEAMPFLKNEIVESHVKHNFDNFSKLRWIPFYRYMLNDPKIGFREFFFSIINKKPKVNPSHGFGPKYGNKTPFIDLALPSTISDKNIVLNEIISVCKKNNIKLIPFIAPYCSKIVNKNYIQKLKLKIPDLIDLSQGYDDNLFYDCGHLNEKGAALFTTDLYHKTISLIQ